MKDQGSMAAQIHGRLNNGSWESSMGSGAVQEQNAAHGAARQLFIYNVSPRGRRLRVCPGLSPSRLCTFQVLTVAATRYIYKTKAPQQHKSMES